MLMLNGENNKMGNNKHTDMTKMMYGSMDLVAQHVAPEPKLFEPMIFIPTPMFITESDAQDIRYQITICGLAVHGDMTWRIKMTPETVRRFLPQQKCRAFIQARDTFHTRAWNAVGKSINKRFKFNEDSSAKLALEKIEPRVIIDPILQMAFMGVLNDQQDNPLPANPQAHIHQQDFFPPLQMDNDENDFEQEIAENELVDQVMNIQIQAPGALLQVPDQAIVDDNIDQTCEAA